MTTDRHIERDLPAILGEIAMGRYPDYIDDVLATTAQRRQRPAWTFPERWLPVELVTTRVPTTRLPIRQLGVLALIAILLAAMLAVYIGSQQQRLPAPFGIARSGLVAFDAGGDIHVVDPATGDSRAIVTGPEIDSGPRFSRDGTKVVFARDRNGSFTTRLFVVDPDGSHIVQITDRIELTPSQLGEPWENYQFSPDGRTVLIASVEQAAPGISIAQSDGRGIRRLDVGMAAYEPSFRPPRGDEILFVGFPGKLASGHGLYAVDASTGAVRTIVDARPGFDLAGANWSPDGSQVAYWTWGPSDLRGRSCPPADCITASTHIVRADGTGDRRLEAPPDVAWTSGSDWSNDGQRLLVLRGYSAHFEDVRPAVVPADGSSFGIEIDPPINVNAQCCAFFEWSPDDSMILGTPADARGESMQQVIIDARTGEITTAPWDSTSDPTWQRLAP